MFIMSQDKTSLIDITGKEIYIEPDEHNTIYVSGCGCSSFIGEYKTEGRAKGVLDNICLSVQLNKNVYVMPEE